MNKYNFEEYNSSVKLSTLIENFEDFKLLHYNCVECVPYSLFYELALWKYIGYVLAKLNF